MQDQHTSAFCRNQRPRHPGRWMRWIFPITGLLSLLWFLVRVVPKPSRAMYPCQRMTMPLASGFVAWLVALAASVTLFKKAGQRLRESRAVLVCMCLTTAAIMGVVSVGNLQPAGGGGPWGPHGPMGEAKGIHPGRVVWVHDPNATDWEGYSSPQHWWQSDRTNQVVAEKMLSQAIRGVAGRNSDAAAWDALFRYFNDSRGKGNVGYQAGERIAVKINLTSCNAKWGNVDPVTYNKKSSILNNTDNSPQLILSLLRQLTNTVGVDQHDITIGDPTGMVPSYYWNVLRPEFRDVRFLDNYGGAGRTRTELSNVPFHWSTPAAQGKLQDYLPTAFAEADYIVNFAILKGHSSGVTLCAKNHYGSLLRTPEGYMRPELPGLPGNGKFLDYYNMHYSLPNAGQNPPWSPGTARYRALVDLMGHSELGGKTVLYLLDGLYGGYYADSHPYKWRMPPFNNDWPSSLFASQDPVAIDSVGYDFVKEEWPDVVRYGHSPSPKYDMQGGAEDYLHEAALANDPCSGTFYDPDHAGNVQRLASLGVHEHWNNATDKQYSKNLGTGTGIELVLLHSDAIEGDVDSDGRVDMRDLLALCQAWSAPPDPNDPGADLNGDRIVDSRDLAILGKDWGRVTSQR